MEDRIKTGLLSVQQSTCPLSCFRAFRQIHGSGQPHLHQEQLSWISQSFRKDELPSLHYCMACLLYLDEMKLYSRDISKYLIEHAMVRVIPSLGEGKGNDRLPLAFLEILLAHLYRACKKDKLSDALTPLLSMLDLLICRFEVSLCESPSILLIWMVKLLGRLFHTTTESGMMMARCFERTQAAYGILHDVRIHQAQGSLFYPTEADRLFILHVYLCHVLLWHYQVPFIQCPIPPDLDLLGLFVYHDAQLFRLLGAAAEQPSRLNQALLYDALLRTIQYDRFLLLDWLVEGHPNLLHFLLTHYARCAHPPASQNPFHVSLLRTLRSYESKGLIPYSIQPLLRRLSAYVDRQGRMEE